MSVHLSLDSAILYFIVILYSFNHHVIYLPIIFYIDYHHHHHNYRHHYHHLPAVTTQVIDVLAVTPATLLLTVLIHQCISSPVQLQHQEMHYTSSSIVLRVGPCWSEEICRGIAIRRKFLSTRGKLVDLFAICRSSNSTTNASAPTTASHVDITASSSSAPLPSSSTTNSVNGNQSTRSPQSTLNRGTVMHASIPKHS